MSRMMHWQWSQACPVADQSNTGRSGTAVQASLVQSARRPVKGTGAIDGPIFPAPSSCVASCVLCHPCMLAGTKARSSLPQHLAGRHPWLILLAQLLSQQPRRLCVAVHCSLSPRGLHPLSPLLLLLLLLQAGQHLAGSQTAAAVGCCHASFHWSWA